MSHRCAQANSAGPPDTQDVKTLVVADADVDVELTVEKGIR